MLLTLSIKLSETRLNGKDSGMVERAETLIMMAIWTFFLFKHGMATHSSLLTMEAAILLSETICFVKR